MTGVIIQVITLILFLFFFEFFLVQAYNMIFRGYAPFLATKSVALRRLLGELKIKEGAKVYELGAGRAGFLRMLRKQYPELELIGVEYSFFPWLIGRLQSAVGKGSIKFVRQNILKVDLSDADVVYCYLNVSTMNKLEEKLGHEMRDGTQVVSYQFPLPSKEPEKVIDLGEEGKIFFYRY